MVAVPATPSFGCPALHDQALIDEAVRTTLLERVIDGIYLDRPLTTRIKPAFETACWTFSRNEHHIFIGNAVFPMERARELATNERLALYQALFRHELAHAEYTVRDFDKVNRMCKRAGAPFMLFNVFEDCRIEQRVRDATGRPFGWATFMAQPMPAADALQLLFKMVEEERADVQCADTALLERVRGYRERIVAAPDALSLEPVLAEWVREFGHAQQKDKPGRSERPGEQGGPGKEAHEGPGPAGRGELPVGAQLADPERLAQFAQDCVEAGAPGRGKVEATPNLEQLGTGMLGRDGALDWQQAANVATVLRAAMAGTVRKTSTTEPTRRLNLRAMGRPDAPQYRRAELVGRKRLRVALVIDCSGSMNGEPIQAARVLAGALHLLQRAGLADGSVTLSGTQLSEHFELTEHARIEAISACGGGEGLERNLRKYLSQLRKADATLVFTDAQLTDGAIDKRALRTKGLTTTGLYVGAAADCGTLDDYFDTTLVRANMEELAAALVRHFAHSRNRGPQR